MASEQWWLSRVVRLLKQHGVKATVKPGRDANGPAYEIDIMGTRYQARDDESPEEMVDRLRADKALS